MTTDQGKKALADAGLAGSQGRFYDVKTGLEVPEANADIRLKTAQASSANANAATLPGYRSGLIQNGQTVAGADLTRANTYAQTQPVIAGADASRAAAYGKAVNQTGTYQQGILAARQQVGANGKLPNGFTPQQDQSLAKEGQQNVTNAAMLAHEIQTKTSGSGAALNSNDLALKAGQVKSLQDRNAEINSRRSRVLPMPVSSGGMTPVPAANLGPLPTFSPNLPGANRPQPGKKLNLHAFMP